MLDLAPNHKAGLVVGNPILLGGGVAGCAENLPPALKNARCGAIVVGPFTHSPRRGRDGRRLGEGRGYFILDTGLQNRGVRSSVKQFGRIWARLGSPVIAQVADTMPDDALRTCELLARTEAISGIELLLHREAGAGDVRALAGALTLECELPLWVKTPFAGAKVLAAAAVEAGANAVVLSQAPIGMVTGAAPNGRPGAGDTEQTVRGVSGALHSPSVFPLILQRVVETVSLDLGVTVIASGGIHGWADVRAAMAAGADAIQLDGAVWVEPGLAAEIVREWEDGDGSDLFQ